MSRIVWLAGALSLLALFLTSCSPAYVMRAGWEEAQILLKRESIKKLAASPDTSEELRKKFNLVLDARDFAESVGLVPNKSFTQYSKVDRDVLLWVLSASKKTSFTPKIWWFPIVGKVPYKGFFDKDDALAEMESLKKKNYDVYLRPSAAFSTLGWFNDPLLSTVLSSDEEGLANLVIHEILHNTVWIKDNVPFNESLANFVGSAGSKEFFLKRGETDKAKSAEDRWHDEKRFASIIADTHNTLSELYNKQTTDLSPGPHEDEILKKRKVIFEQAIQNWEAEKIYLKTTRYKNIDLKLNNAVIIAQKIYLSELESFEAFYNALAGGIAEFVQAIRELNDDGILSKTNPFKALKSATDLSSQSSS